MAKRARHTKIFMAVALSDRNSNGIVTYSSEGGSLTGKFNLQEIKRKFAPRQRVALGHIIGLAKLLKELQKKRRTKVTICTNNQTVTEFLNGNDYKPLMRLVGDMPPRTAKTRPAFYTLQGRLVQMENHYNIGGETVTNDHPVFAEIFREAQEIVADEAAHRAARDASAKAEIRDRKQKNGQRRKGRPQPRCTDVAQAEAHDFGAA